VKRTILYGVVMRGCEIDGLATYQRNRAMRASAERLRAIQARMTAQVEQQKGLGK
jgi:hypothetical protein